MTVFLLLNTRGKRVAILLCCSHWIFFIFFSFTTPGIFFFFFNTIDTIFFFFEHFAKYTKKYKINSLHILNIFRCSSSRFTPIPFLELGTFFVLLFYFRLCTCSFFFFFFVNINSQLEYSYFAKKNSTVYSHRSSRLSIYKYMFIYARQTQYACVINLCVVVKPRHCFVVKKNLFFLCTHRSSP